MSQVIFFDGVCLLCNGFVDFLLRADRERHFQFAPLQGENARRMLPPEYVARLHSVVLWSQGQVWVKSDAVLQVLVQLGGAWALTRVFWLVPRFVRDMLYDVVASRRYRWFGKQNSCRMPKPEERARFLD